ncbi:MAG TPA: DUF6756 family protein [Cyclobacteriaceae bacterium]
MHWDEKIDKLKKETDPDDFKVPFTDWSTILKKIEDKFIVKENSNYVFSNWADRLKDKEKIKELKTVDLEAEVAKLTPEQNYWIVLTGDNSATKNLVYDGKPGVILKLLQLRDGDFYIGDKKYNWLTYFKCNQTDIEVFRSGDQQTPWDKK